ncbi:YaiI/YqxD family protein [Zavarzinia sp.]|uniref:YaiI/YqxD family protein n=1 Tax=Zavarzinia sp. TaxID=2027920 RepID=UPI003BB5473B
MTILVDGDACPVKPEVFKVAERYNVPVIVIANSFINLPRNPLFERVIVSDGFDAADDWIAERADAVSIVVTADVPLAARAVKAGATAIAPSGRSFTEAGMGLALATRNLMTELRAAGEVTSGPRAFSARDRSTFLSALDEAVNRLRRKGA